MQTTGSKAQVWHGTAKHTSGGLTKNNLMKNKHGRIVSKKKHSLGKKSIKNLKKLGYIAKKGQFKLFHKKGRSRKMRGGMNHPSTVHNSAASTNKPMRGGMAYGGPLAPHSYDGKGQGTSGVALQFVAGNAA
jgi:hypothetical protein